MPEQIFRLLDPAVLPVFAGSHPKFPFEEFFEAGNAHVELGGQIPDRERFVQIVFETFHDGAQKVPRLPDRGDAEREKGQKFVAFSQQKRELIFR